MQVVVDWLKARTWKEFVETATLIVIIFGLYFAYDQAVKIKESIGVNNKNISVTAWSNISTATFDLDQILIDNSEFQKYFYEGEVIDKSDRNYPKVYAIGVMYLDYFDYVASFTNSFVGELPNSLLEIETWENYFRSTLTTSPLLCEMYLKNISNYGSSIRRVAEPTCRSNFTKASPPPPVGR